MSAAAASPVRHAVQPAGAHPRRADHLPPETPNTDPGQPPPPVPPGPEIPPPGIDDPQPSDNPVPVREPPAMPTPMA